MSAYLARLKQLENGKNSQYATNSEPPKPPKAPFDPFGGKHSAHIEKKIIDDAEITTQPSDAAGEAVSEPIPDLAMEARRQRVLAMLADNPALRLAVVCDGQGDPVPVAIAIRDKATCEVLIPAVHFDPFTLLDLVERHSGTVH